MTHGPGRFANDDGAPDHGIREAADAHELRGALSRGRVLVAVVATASTPGAGSVRSRSPGEQVGERVDEGKDTDMAVVSMVTADGRRGLLVFSGVDSLRAWDGAARPVPVSGPDAALAAIQEGCEALVVDVAGPRTQVVTESDMVTLAGVDPLEHACTVAQLSMDAVFGPGRVSARALPDRLRLEFRGIDAQEVARAIPARVVALAPRGVEIVQRDGAQ